MVYGSKTGGFKRRRTFKKRSFKPKMTTASAGMFLAKKAYRMALKVAGVVNAEKKWYDNDISNTPNSSGIVNLITNIGQGDGASTRDGNSIAIKSYLNNIYLLWNTAGAVTTSCRAIIFIDKNDNNGSIPAVTDVLKSATVWSPLNLTNSTRFKILYDKRFSRDLQVNTIYDSFFHKFFNKKDYSGNPTVQHHCTWYDDTGSHTNEGHLYSLLVSSESANLPTLDMHHRIRFYDN